MGGYLLANIILGVPVAIAALIMCHQKNKSNWKNDCKQCAHLEKINSRPLGGSYKYICSKGGRFDKQPAYCRFWKARES